MNNQSEFIAPQDYSWDTFPEASAAPEGMLTLNEPLDDTYPHVILNVPYAQKNGLSLHLHVITPVITEKSQEFPLIMWVQGSAFHKQFLGNHLAHFIEVAKRGYVVAMVEYRWAPENPFPAQIKDLKTATRFMLAHASDYHVNPKQYIAWGDSSGGHTVTTAVVTENLPEFNDEDTTVLPLHYAACIDFYGPTDISRMNKVPSTQDHVSPHSLEGEFFGTNDLYKVPELVQKGNPISYISSKKLPPFLIMHGSKDRLVPFEQSVLLYNALKENHQNVTFYKMTKSDHGTDAFFTPTMIDLVDRFIRKTL
ncbi:alpha/beta hydrolase [Lactiplantibacillus pingfangensis]|uniref:alpha/beta hydrolase n=1 Tax=Lactiplantibacillus pingfangensis TaxID=2559915 RepID=UPI001CC36C5C|nr:alpha/beta hydrolase [Lactiplantibacillus pingfangensis]